MGICISKPVLAYNERESGAIEAFKLRHPKPETKKYAEGRKEFFRQKLGEGNLEALKRGDIVMTSGAPEYRPFAIIRKPSPLPR